jgi:nucleoside-diphosphate-sugar epimerase
MTYFITGSSGFIGNYLIDSLKDQSIIIPHSYKKNHFNFPDVSVDHVIHLGAEIKKDSLMVESNILYTYNLLNYFKNKKIKSFIYVGSSSEYGYKDHPISENDLLEPRTLYESTKGCGSLLAKSFAFAYDMPIRIVRPFSIYGYGESSDKLIPCIFKSILFDKHIDIYEGYHDYLHITDFIEDLKAIMYNDSLPGNIINCGSGCQLSNFEILDIIENITGKAALCIKYTKRRMYSYDSINWVADISKISGFPYYRNREISIEEGLLQYWRKFTNV